MTTARPATTAKWIDTDILLRAIAICAVVLNHAHLPDAYASGMGGGMTLLFVLSGYSFARFALDGPALETAPIRALKFAWELLWPSAILIILFSIARQKFVISDLLFFRNWIDVGRVAFFPIWYVQVVVQMMAFLAIAMSLKPVRRAFAANPVATSVSAFALFAAIRVIAPTLWDTTHLRNQLPHLFLWNFALGWVVYFCVSRADAHPRLRLLALACLIAGMFAGWPPYRSDFWVLLAGGAFLIFVRRVVLPGAVRQGAILLSEATFAIFLIHKIWISVAKAVHAPASAEWPWVVFVFALGGSLACWFAMTALYRAFRRRYDEIRNPGDSAIVRIDADRARAVA
jgi:hypothetical protein